MVLELQKFVSFPFREHLEREDKEVVQLDVPVHDPVRVLKRRSLHRVVREFILDFFIGLCALYVGHSDGPPRADGVIVVSDVSREDTFEKVGQ